MARLTLILAMTAAIVVAGCSPETRYSVLSFFFDGVPLPGQNVKTGIRGDERRGDRQAHAWSHGPYAAKMCNACHQEGGGNKLILPVEKLCLNCHDLNLKTKHVHGPVASGGCRVCHDPHGTGRRYMLVADPKTFCFYCHDRAEVGSREVHKAAGTMQCTECHNPHGSNNQFLLKD